MAMVWALVDLDIGVPFAALRDHRFEIAADGETLCAVSGSGVAGPDAAFSIQFFQYDSAGERLVRSWDRFVRAPLADVRGQARVVAHRDPGGSTVGRFFVGPDMMAAELDGVVALAIDDGGATVVSGAFAAGNVVQNLHLVGRDILWENWASSVRLAAWAGGGEAFVLRESMGGDIRGFASDLGTDGDGSSLAWLEASGQDEATGRYARVDLWTATYGGGALRDARRVRQLNDHDGGMLGDGLYVRAEVDDLGATVYAFYRLSDGARATFVPDRGAPDQVLAVTATEVLLLSWATYYRVDPRVLVYEPL